MSAAVGWSVVVVIVVVVVVVIVGGGLWSVVWVWGLACVLSGVKLDCCGCTLISAVQVERHRVLLNQLFREMLRREVRGFLGALDLKELHGPAGGLLLEPEGAHVKLTYAADHSACENAQCSRRIHMDAGSQADTEVRCKGNHAHCLCRYSYNRQ